MLRRLTSFILIAVLFCTYSILPTNATEIADTTDIFIVLDQERIERIDELYAIRAKLALDYTANQEMIEKIDTQLAHLGVEEITYQDLITKFGRNISPNVSVTSTSTTNWTSTRVLTSYYGKMYELQIITGTPKDPVNSSLVADYSISLKETYGGAAGAIAVLKVVASSISGHIPVLGDGLTANHTLYDVLTSYFDGISPTTVVSGSTASYGISMLAHERYVFVKEQGKSDSTQICAFIGNHVEWTVGVTLPIRLDKDGDGDLDTATIQFSYDDTMTGPGYSSYYEIATRNFYNHSNGVQNFIVDYRLITVNSHLLYNKNTNDGFSQRLSVPTENMTFLS